jgi:hypothetical protein
MVDDYSDYEAPAATRPRDNKVEDIFFHWITEKALNELAEERRINFSEESTEHHRAHFYWPRRHRYPRRQIGETLD